MVEYEHYMNQALIQAFKAYENNEVPVGAVIVYDNQIIARAYNQIKMLKDPTAHAEMIAITQAAAFMKNERLNGCDLYVTIEPCAMCVGALILGRFRRIIYGAPDPKTGACGSRVDISRRGLFNHDLEVIGGVLENECGEVMRRFFMEKRSVS
jgi:tRNA(adenine34) deaminase